MKMETERDFYFRACPYLNLLDENGDLNLLDERIKISNLLDERIKISNLFKEIKEIIC